jgi:WD40 repeat protein
MTNRVAFSPDGKYIAIGGGYTNRGIQIWEVQTGQQFRSFHVNAIEFSAVFSAVFSPDGKYLLTGGLENNARVWDVITGKEARPFIGHVAGILTAIYSPDGRYVATASLDKTARLWDAQTRKELRRFTGHTAPVEYVAFSPNGKYLLTGSDDGTAMLWDVDYHTTMQYLCSVLLRDFTETERTQYNIKDNTPTCPKP